MCRCPAERRYLMVWSSENELKFTIQRVHDHCRSLKESSSQEATPPRELHLPLVALGAERDRAEHLEDSINVEPCGGNEILSRKNDDGTVPIHSGDASDSALTTPEVISDEDRGEGVLGADTDDEIEVVGVRDANSSSY